MTIAKQFVLRIVSLSFITIMLQLEAISAVNLVYGTIPLKLPLSLEVRTLSSVFLPNNMGY